MRTYTIKGETHAVYDLDSEVPQDIVVNPDWKNSRRGDWVLADDGSTLQVLDVKQIGKTTAIVTCIGTYSVEGTMDTSEREDRYNLNGKNSYNTLKERKKPTDKEVQFVNKVVRGVDALKAYMDTYNTNSEAYAKRRAALLLKTERINTLMNPTKEELTEVFNGLGVDLKFLIERAKDQVEGGKTGSDKIAALKMLWEAYGVIEKQKITEIAGVFQGFEPAQIEDAKRPELPEYQSLGDESI